MMLCHCTPTVLLINAHPHACKESARHVIIKQLCFLYTWFSKLEKWFTFCAVNYTSSINNIIVNKGHIWHLKSIPWKKTKQTLHYRHIRTDICFCNTRILFLKIHVFVYRAHAIQNFNQIYNKFVFLGSI